MLIAQATGKVIARAIGSAIYACCDCNYSQIVWDSMWLHITSRMLLCQTDTVESHYLNTALCKQAMNHKAELNGTFVSQEAHDLKQDSEMLPRFRVAHKQSMVGPFKSWVASHAQHRTAMAVSFNFSNTPLLLCNTYFGVFSFHFLTPR